MRGCLLGSGSVQVWREGRTVPGVLHTRFLRVWPAISVIKYQNETRDVSILNRCHTRMAYKGYSIFLPANRLPFLSLSLSLSYTLALSPSPFISHTRFNSTMALFVSLFPSFYVFLFLFFLFFFISFFLLLCRWTPDCSYTV